MGFVAQKVISDNVSEFICKICSDLSEHPVVAQCKNEHVFCAFCLEQWFQHGGKQTCPTCNQSCANCQGVDLDKHSKIAARIYENIRVRCPLDDDNNNKCAWIGSVSEVAKHLTSVDAHHKTETETTQQKNTSSTSQQQDSSGDKKGLLEQAGNYYDSKNYREALQVYSKSLSLEKTCEALLGRAQCWENMHAFNESIKDIREAYDVANSVTEIVRVRVSGGQVREERAKFWATIELMRVLIRAGQYDAAVSAVQLRPDVANDVPSFMFQQAKNLADLAKEAKKDEEQKRYEKAIEKYQMMMDSGCESADIDRARCMLSIGLNLTQTLKLTLDIIRRDDSRVDAHALRGRALCLSADGDFENGIKFFKHCLSQAPDDTQTMRHFKDAKKIKLQLESGRLAHENREFSEAVDFFTASLDENDFIPKRCPLYARILVERANSYLRLNKPEKCREDAENAIAAIDDYKPAYFTLANAHLKLKAPRKAIEVLECLQKLLPDDAETKSRIEKATFEARKIERVDYYELLGITSLASAIEVKQAYKKKAMQFHPDRISNDATDEEKAQAETNFKLLGEAMEILENEMQKQLYDQGYDREAIQERVEAAKRSAFGRQHHGHAHSHH
jgi:tetratricopeptide (TPR) repeat protein